MLDGGATESVIKIIGRTVKRSDKDMTVRSSTWKTFNYKSDCHKIHLATDLSLPFAFCDAYCIEISFAIPLKHFIHVPTVYTG